MPIENQLNLLLEIDQICDDARDESTLALQLVAYLAEAVNAEMAAFSLPDEYQPDIWKLQAITDRGELLGRITLSQLTEIAEEAVDYPHEHLYKVLEEMGEGMPRAYVMAVPQFLNGEVLGVLLVVKLGSEFSEEEKGLIQVATTRMDSALRHIRTLQKLEQEALALRTVLQVDRIRDTSQTMDEMLDRSLTEVIQVIAAEAGYIMLYDRQGNRLELRAITDQQFQENQAVFKKLYDL